MDIRRYLEGPVGTDLSDKMVLLAGPRQVGKTTLARQLLAQSADGLYLSWDHRDDRREIRAARWPGGNALVVLDELHKWRPWKGCTCSPCPHWRRPRDDGRLRADVGARYAARSARRSRGSVTVPGFAIARRVASARYAAGSRPASFADSSRL